MRPKGTETQRGRQAAAKDTVTRKNKILGSCYTKGDGGSMLLALNGATTMKADLATDVKAAAQAGFDLIEIWAAKLRRYLDTHTAQDLQLLLQEHRMLPYSINSIEHITFRSRERHAELLRECSELCEIAEQIDCDHLVVVPSPRPDGISEKGIIEESVQTLRQLSRVASGGRVKLAFEFLGPPDCSVRTLAQCREIISRVDRSNVGLVIDTFHFYVGDSSLDSISELDPSRLFIFHINDAENRPKSELEDRHRLLPGLGILPLREIWSALQNIGYDRMASVEIFRPEYWEWDPFDLASRAMQALTQVLGIERRAG